MKNYLSMRTRQTAATLVLSAIFFLSGCRTESSPEAAARPESPTASSPAAASFALQSAHGGEAGRGSEAPGSPAGLVFELPAQWSRSIPTSAMRVLQATVPGPAGDGELVVFYFGSGQGGGVEANFDRWIGQMDGASGGAPERGKFVAAEFRISWLDVRGTLLPSGMGSGPATPQPGARLLGAVVEGEGGPWFVKLTGPEATVAAERDGFLGMLRAIHR